MSKRALNNKGFTLIEIIASLVILGIVTAVVGLSAVQMVKSFLFSGKNSGTLLKGQIAIARIQKELNNAKTVYVSGTNGTKITFTSYKDTVPVDHTLSWAGSGNDLLWDSIVLTDKVSSFSLAYYNNYNGTANTAFSANSKIIEVNLVLTGADNVTAAFSVRVAPSFDILLGT